MLSNDGRSLVFIVFVLSVLCEKTRSQANMADGILSYTTTEKRPVGSTLGNVASDAGLYKELSPDVLQKLTYTITSAGGSPNATEYLSVVDGVGLLQVRKVINRDLICPQRSDCDIPFNVLLQPRDYFRVIKVNVAVVDLNDYTPTFDPPHFNLSISESSAVGEVCVFPPAIDLDSPPNGVVAYTLDPDRDPFRLIVYNSSGFLEPRLNLTSPLDRDTQAFYSLKLNAFDGGSPPRTGSLILEITVLDANDNPPTFDQSVYVVYVPENASIGSELVTVHATGRDSGSNARIWYSFSQRSQNQFGTVFKVDPQSGKVTLLRMLNAAETGSYNLTVQAIDGSQEGLVGFAALRIVVVAQQDTNSPPAITVDFLNGDGVARIREFSDSGAFVALVSIAVQNGQTVRCFVNDTQNFLLLPLLASEYKLVTARPLDASTQGVYWTALTCALAKDAKIFTVKVFPVSIIPSPVKPPVFLNSSYEAKVPAYAPVNTVVLGVRADLDTISGRNLTVVYSLDRDSGGRFTIDPQSGLITTASTAYFRASDVGTNVEFHAVAFYRQFGNNLTSRAAIRVTVVDGGVRPPRFPQKHYNFSVPETTSPDSAVGSVVANASPGESVSYSLTSSPIAEASSRFRINETSGLIYTTGFLISGENAAKELSVVARNAKFPDLNDSARVDVYILENRPEITFSGITISNDNTVHISISSTGRPVATVTVRLPLPGPPICFSLLSHSDLFSIDAQSGEIRLKSNVSSPQLVNQTLALEIQAFVCSFPFARSTKTLSLKVDPSSDPTGLDPSSSPTHGDSRTVIVASVLGICLVLVLLIIVALVCIRLRRRHSRRSNKAPNEESVYMATTLTSPPQPQRSYPMVFDPTGSRRSTLADFTLELPQGSTQFVGSSEELDADSGYPSNSSSSQTSSDDGGGGGGGGGGAGGGGAASSSMVDGRGRDYPTTASTFIASSGKGVDDEVPVFTTTASSNFYGTEVAKWVRASANSLSDRWTSHRRSSQGATSKPPADPVVVPAQGTSAGAASQPTILKPSLSRSGSVASRRSLRFTADGTMVVEAKKRVTFAEEDQFREVVVSSDDVTDSPSQRSKGTDDDVSSDASSLADDSSESRQTVINTIANSYATGSQYPPAGTTFGSFRPEDGSLV